MTDEEEEALIEMFSKLAVLKNTYTNILNAAQNGVEEIVKNAGVSREKMSDIRKKGEERARENIEKGN